LGRKWVTRKKTSKADVPELIYGIVCVALILWMIIYSVVTGTAPENNGFE
jgi:hypothetical protein